MHGIVKSSSKQHSLICHYTAIQYHAAMKVTCA